MLKFFLSARFSRFVIAFFMCLIYWFPAYMIKPETAEMDVSLINLKNIPFAGFHVFWIAALLLTFFTAVLTNQISGESGFTRRLTTTELLVYVLFSSAAISFVLPNTIILINFLLLFFIALVFKLPTTGAQQFLSYNAGLLLGISALFLLPMLLFIFLFWFALLIHRSNDVRNYIASLLGLFTPLMFVFVWYYWFNQTSYFLESIASSIVLNPGFILSLPVTDYITLGIFLILTLQAGLQATIRLTEKSINQRRNLMITLYFFAFAVTVSVFFGNESFALLLIGIPASLLLAHSLQNVRHRKVFGTVISGLALLILVNHYLNLFI